ncbi:MAG TPA: glycosyltransferase [Candidatus Dormibacteraeota bacterium]
MLILFSDTGGGHRAAAKALTQAINRVAPNLPVEMADPLIGEGPRVVRRLAKLYSPLIQRSRPAWGVVYHASNTRPVFATIRGVFSPTVRRVLLDLIERHDPDVVVSVHPLLNHVTYQAIHRSSRRRGLVVVVTDLVELHRGWAFSKADLVTVPTESARQACLRWGVKSERLYLLGLPVDLRFRPPAPGEKAALRRRFGLAEDRLTVLAVAGGEGSGNLLQQVRALAWHEHPWQTIAVTGRNDKLRRRLARLHFGTPTQVLGFVDDMPELMRASDVVVSKAGPGAIAEALATHLPMILTSYLPGQETDNVTFVSMTGFGLYSPKPDQLLDSLNLLFAEDGRVLSEMAERAAAVARPYASLDIAREALAVARRYSAESQASR